MNGHYSEMPRWMIVSKHVAAENALASFMLSGGMPHDTVEWNTTDAVVD